MIPAPLKKESIFHEKEYDYDSLLIEDVWSAAQWLKSQLALRPEVEQLAYDECLRLIDEAFGACESKEEKVQK